MADQCEKTITTRAIVGDKLQVTEAEQDTTRLLNGAIHSQLVVATVVHQVNNMADSEQKGRCGGAIGDYISEGDCQETNI